MNPNRQRLAGDPGRTRSGVVAGFALFALMACNGEAQRVHAGEPDGLSRFGDPEAKALAVRVHGEARAMDKLPRFYYRVESGNADVETMLDMEECSFQWLAKALDEPNSKERWYQSTETLAWSNQYAVCSSFDRRYKNETQESKGDKSRQDRVWTREEAFERGESDRHGPRFVFTQTPDVLWSRRLNSFAYFRVTPHRFWWGTSDDHSDTISSVPPELAAYRFADREQFDDELCDVVESAARAERLWISRKSHRLRGVLVSIVRGGMPAEPFHTTEFVEKMAGRPIASQQEFQEWVAGLTASQKTELTIAWNEKYFNLFGPNELIRFRDYREVAPDVWVPFREDRAWTHPAGKGRKGHKYIHLWVAVQEARTGVDLSDTVEKLRPNDGDQIEDQRFGVVLKYKFRQDRTQGELREMADAEKERPGAIKFPVKEKPVQK